jgi:hypothetical protein
VLDLDDDGGLLELMHVGRRCQHLMKKGGRLVWFMRACECLRDYEC